MFNVSTEELQTVLLQLDQAIYNHEQWYKDIMRTLVCRLPYDNRNVAEDAHRQCRFGQWYYNNAPPKLLAYAPFIAIDIEHERLHQVTALLLRESATGTSISPSDYDNFANTLDRLRLEILTLKREIEDSLFNHDPLTGAESRLGMLTKLRELLEQVKRRIQHCCIAIMDLDHFKTINDTYGHPIGDHVLKASVQHLMGHLRPYDKVFRYGGDEFLICMPNTDMETGRMVAERLREELAITVLAQNDQNPIYITVSFGITLLDPDVSVEESIDRADKALYAAKQAGRNRSLIWDPSM
ncbi:MAG: diguanylate cyclase [Thermodesulfovibrionales bacterium]